MKVGIILHFSKGVIVSSVLIISAQRRVQKYLISLTGSRNRVVSDRVVSVRIFSSYLHVMQRNSCQ